MKGLDIGQTKESAMLLKDDYQIAPCLKSGPLAKVGKRLILASRRMGDTWVAATLRSWCVAAVFTSMERIFSEKEHPLPRMIKHLNIIANFLEKARVSGLSGIGLSAKQDRHWQSMDQFTAEHYGQLFKSFDHRSFWEEPVKLLSQRLERNGLEPSKIAEGKRVLDAGCGGGRYSVAWRALGAKLVIGLDFSWQGIYDAQRRVKEARLDGLEFMQGDVLALPFREETFDVVFSNGVLHHTSDWRRGVKELLRVLRPGGFGWLYLIENPGGLFWDVIEILRVLMRGANPDVARNALYLTGLPPNRVFYMLDHVLVPINVRLRPDEIEQCLQDAGAAHVRRLQRGTDFDRIERIFQGEAYATIKYGVGENRYVFTKF